MRVTGDVRLAATGKPCRLAAGSARGDVALGVGAASRHQMCRSEAIGGGSVCCVSLGISHNGVPIDPRLGARRLGPVDSCWHTWPVTCGHVRGTGSLRTGDRLSTSTVRGLIPRRVRRMNPPGIAPGGHGEPQGLAVQAMGMGRPREVRQGRSSPSRRYPNPPSECRTRDSAHAAHSTWPPAGTARCAREAPATG